MTIYSEAPVLVKMVFGSDLYGTRTSRSDQDYRGVFMPSVRSLGDRGVEGLPARSRNCSQRA